MQPSRKYRDATNFAKAWIANPFRTGAVLPSSAALAGLMVKEVDVGGGPILELGPGTGVFTKALIDRGMPPVHMNLVEFNEAFASLLAIRFPDVCLVHGDASRIERHEKLRGKRFSATLSGLPLVSMPVRTVLRTLWGVFRAMPREGVFYQFTYGPVCPIRSSVMDRLGLTARIVGRTYWNVPPATVYAISRVRDHR